MHRGSLKDIVVRDPSPKIQVFSLIPYVLQDLWGDWKKRPAFGIPGRQGKQSWHHDDSIAKSERVLKNSAVSGIKYLYSISSWSASAVNQNRTKFPHDDPLSVGFVSNSIGPQILRICNEGSLGGCKRVPRYVGALLCRFRTVLYGSALSFHLN